MPELTITPPASPPPYDFLANADRIHQIAGYNFPAIFDHYFSNQWVFKGPGYFLMGGHDPDRPDAWLVWWAELNPTRNRVTLLRLFLRMVPYHKPWIGWARPLKGRVDIKYYSTERLLKFTQKTSA